MSSKILLNSGASERGWHRIQTWLQCKQLYAYKYLMKFEGAPSYPLIRGSVLHTGLAHYYAQMRATQQGSDPGRYYDPQEAAKLCAETFGAAGEAPLAAVTPVLADYMNTWANDKMKVLHVEEQFSAMLRNKWKFTARWDLVSEDMAGKVWIYDHKTTSKYDAKVLLGYTLSGQILMARHMGAAIWGDKFAGVRLNFVGFGARVFTRQSPEVAPNLVGRMVDTICRAEEEIEKFAAEGVDPMQYPPAVHEHMCMTRYGACPHFATCQWGR